jgi:DeoR family fructose operon transcriptional repressor
MFEYVRSHTMKHRFAHERQAELRTLLSEEGTVAVTPLAKRWKVSEMTIRRDLQALQAEGSVTRVHGGAVAGGTLRFGNRLGQHRREKELAAGKLATLLPTKGSVYLDGSTTIYHLAELLGRHGGLQVATNNLDTFLRLGQTPGVEAVLIGGTLNRGTDNFVGPHARRCLEGLAFDAAFFSAFALHGDLGPCEPAVEDAEIKQLVCARAARVHLAVDHHKLGQQAVGSWRFAAGRATLATDLPAGDARLKPFRLLFATVL